MARYAQFDKDRILHLNGRDVTKKSILSLTHVFAL